MFQAKGKEEGLSHDFGHPDDIHGIERKVLCSNLMSEKDDDDVRGSDDGDLMYVVVTRSSFHIHTHTHTHSLTDPSLRKKMCQEPYIPQIKREEVRRS